jgi:prophage regulatory protein
MENKSVEVYVKQSDSRLGAYPRMLRLKDVEAITGLSRSTIYNLISEDQFPRQIHLSSKSVGWWDAEILNWVQDRMDRRALPKPVRSYTSVALK